MPYQLVTHLDENWQRHVANVRQASLRLWAKPAHRHVIDHGPTHAERVIALLDGLTEGLMARKQDALAPEEIYILLAAAYLHAIGLQDEQSVSDPLARLTSYPALSAEMIYRAIESPQAAADLGLLNDPSLIEMTALVAKRQRETVYPSPDYDDFPVGNVTVRPRLLTALLHLADGFDLDCRRVDLEQLKLMRVPPDEALDWWLHHYVSGVQIADEFARIGYRVPLDRADYEGALPDLVERELRTDFDSLRDTFRLYGVKVDIGTSGVRPMRAVQPMPADVWAAAERRLAKLRGVTPVAALVSPLVEKVRGLLATMGYECGPLGGSPGGQTPLTRFACRPKSGGLLTPLSVGCKDGPVEAADVQTLLADAACQQGYVIAETRVLPSALEAAQQSGRVRVFTLASFYNQLLDFRAYTQSLVDGYASSELARYYVDLGCVRYSYDDQGQVIGQDPYKPMDGYVDAWLKESGGQRNHISILGDYGTGKTSFCRQYAAKQGRRWLADPDRERIPLLINLREYTKTLKAESLITDALVNQYDIRGATFETFARFNADGKLLIFFDGFDEMAQRTGLRTAVDNFWELAKVVAPGSKVILTCRTPYFRTHHEAEALLHGQTFEVLETSKVLDQDYIDLRDRPNFEIVHLEPFSDDDIQAVLRARFSDEWQAHWAQIQRIYNLPDLARRPVLLDMIAQTLPELKDGQTINAAKLYGVYTDAWLERDIAKGRTLITSGDRRVFAQELAMGMLRGGELTIHYSRLPERIKAYFKLDKAEEIDYFDADIRTCNFMGRDDAGNYSFAHKSFMEYFAACRLHGLMLQDKATANGPAPINEEIRQFLTGLFAMTPKPEPGPPCAAPEGFVWVPPGEFILGGKNGLELQIAKLEQGFFAASTPVTNAQYAHFVDKTQRKPPEHWKGKRPPENLDHPVVYVSWEDAVAYAEWAGVRLPTEQEWEKAARGYDGREYPWGEWTAGRCNNDDASIGTTSPVGQFSPDGDSPYGLQDAAGNVWEWTASTWASGDNDRVLRGGAFASSRFFVRCALRVGFRPDYRLRDGGFRFVVSPVSPASAL